jgi:hypothetical protein
MLCFAGLVLCACGSADKAPKSEGQPSAAELAKAKPYPLDWCVVSGETLGEMGTPVVKVYQGREVKFCCKNCVHDFEADMPRYLARLDSAAAGQIHQPEPKGQGG